MKYSLTFEKTGTLRYISHLDTMRLFQRSFRRAKFKLRYSEGFNPHIKMSFAQPLSLGYIGLQEFLEFETVEILVAFDVPERLNPLLPPGIRVTSCKELPIDRKESLSALTVSATYDLYWDVSEKAESAEGFVCTEEDALTASVKKAVRAFLNEESILAEKRIKKTKKIGEVEIRPLIRSFAFTERLSEARDVYGLSVPAGALRFSADLLTGSEHNLNPEVLLRAFAKYVGLPFDKTLYAAVREKLEFRSI